MSTTRLRCFHHRTRRPSRHDVSSCSARYAATTLSRKDRFKAFGAITRNRGRTTYIFEKVSAKTCHVYLRLWMCPSLGVVALGLGVAVHGCDCVLTRRKLPLCSTWDCPRFELWSFSSRLCDLGLFCGHWFLPLRLPFEEERTHKVILHHLRSPKCTFLR